jgi:hypothetical protein
MTIGRTSRGAVKGVGVATTALALAVALAACGGSKNTSSSTPAATASGSTSTQATASAAAPKSATFVAAVPTLPPTLDSASFSAGTRPLFTLLDSELFNYAVVEQTRWPAREVVDRSC